MKFVFGDRPVSPDFRLALAGELPGLGENISYWRFLQYLLFSDYRDEETGLTTLPRGLIAAIERKTPDNHYSAIKFLDSFRVDVFDFEVTDHVWHGIAGGGKGKVRAIQSMSIPDTIETLVRAERRHGSQGQQRVCLATGGEWDWRHTKALREAERHEAMSRATEVEMGLETKLALDYLNCLKPNRFTAAMQHLPMAMLMAEHTAHVERELNILHGIQDKPVPTYVPSAKTARLYTLGPSFLHLHRSLRKIICQDWVTADLKSAQLAIVARVWNVPMIRDYLQTERDVWKDLTEHMGLEYGEDAKDILKTALYALLFGAGTRTLQNHFQDSLNYGRARQERFVQHPLIQALLAAREVQFQKIVRDDGAYDACGRFLSLETKVKDGYDIGYDNRRSILACVAQSYEMRLLAPAFKMALEQRDQEHGFTITSLLHDGLTYAAHKATDSLSWQNRLGAVVQRQADSLGILTSLNFS